MPSKKKTLDVRSPKDRKALMDTIAAHPITIILIHADYCGHCQTYKKDIWEPLGEVAEKKNGMAAIHYDQLEGTPFADAKIKGYPSVILVGKKKMAEFEDEEDGKTNAMPSDEARDMNLMTELVSSAEPSTLTGKLKNMSSNVDVGSEEPSEEPATEPSLEPAEEPESPVLNATARAMRNENSVKKKADILANGKKAKRANSVEVPDPGADSLNSQLPESSEMTFQPPAETKEPKVGGGGSLYASLVAAARDVAPAVALTAAAVALHKKRKTRRGKVRKGRKSRKSRN